MTRMQGIPVQQPQVSCFGFVRDAGPPKGTLSSGETSKFRGVSVSFPTSSLSLRVTGCETPAPCPKFPCVLHRLSLHQSPDEREVVGALARLLYSEGLIPNTNVREMK